LEIARGIIDAKDSMKHERVAEVYADISTMYELMTEFEMSLNLMNKTLVLLEGASEKQHFASNISSRMGWLLMLTKRVNKFVPYLESAVDKLTNCFGPKHLGLGFAYKHLGQAYLEMVQHQSAVKFLALAKDIMVATFGPTHEDSIDINHSLANAHGLMGR
jgi:tetratricopeptide (TPR) repeat protein